MSNGKPSLGVVAIAQNEERDLPGFLSHLLPWVAEIVIVDDESTDRTVEIARAAGPSVRVVQSNLQQVGGFDGLRNLGIAQATADWLLHMDIDERVPPALAIEIATAIASPDFDAYRYRRLNFFLHRPMKGGGLQRWNNVQLARRELARFENAVHESLRVDCPPDRVGQLREPMWHLNDAGYVERMRKSEQYCQMVARQHSAEGRSAAWWRLLWDPSKRFAKTYLYYGGYRDGVPGLIWALHSAVADFRVAALRWDEQHHIERDTIDRALATSVPHDEQSSS